MFQNVNFIPDFSFLLKCHEWNVIFSSDYCIFKNLSIFSQAWRQISNHVILYKQQNWVYNYPVSEKSLWYQILIHILKNSLIFHHELFKITLAASSRTRLFCVSILSLALYYFFLLLSNLLKMIGLDWQDFAPSNSMITSFESPNRASVQNEIELPCKEYPK